MAFLRPKDVHHPDATPMFEAVDEQGAVLAEGTLEIELIPGATRHGDVSFVTTSEHGKVPSAFGGMQ
jgi:hypothetical protein